MGVFAYNYSSLYDHKINHEVIAISNPRYSMYLGGGFKYFFMFTPIWGR